ncbi:MAG TPA: carboxypeptidase-like regulatory domain-containing protein [Candidatus Acidoferrales bacterium]
MAALISLAFCPGVLACGCAPPAENLTMYDLVKQSVDRADLVFIGVPTALHGDGKSEDTDDLVIFDASKVFKGEQAAQVRVHSGVGTTSMSSCGYWFEVSKTYLVFASHYGDFALVMPCSFTAPIEKSQVALRFLRKEPPQPEDLLTPTEIQRNGKSRILGAVRRSDGVALHDPKVYIWNDSDPSYEKEAWFTRPENDGSFESYFLPPGTYRVTAVDSSYGPTRWVGCYALQAGDNIPAKVEVMAGHDYRWADIVLHEQKVYSIQGIVRSSDGSPPPFEHVEIRATMTPSEMFPFLDFIQPHADGKFSVPRVPVGTFRLKTYVSEYVDPNWETSVTDVEVNADVEGVEIVLNRKTGTPEKEKPTPD